MTNTAKPLPPAEALREVFAYDPDTGALIWRVRVYRSKVQAGAEAGSSLAKGYRQVRALGHKHLAVHRVVWKMMTGRDPVGEIDHRNGDRADNRWCNLREADGSQNRTNRAPLNKHRGVHFIAARRCWGAQIKAHGQHLWLGCFASAEAACAAYRAKAAELHGEFAKPGVCGCE